MTTDNSLASRVGRLVADPELTTYTEDIYFDAICAAHDAILPWVPNYQSVVISRTSGSGGIFKLPDDLYQMQAVRIGDDKYLSKATLSAGTNRPTSVTACDWIENPKGYLSLSVDEDDLEDDLAVHYLAYWPKPPSGAVGTFVITVPACAHQGMVYYAASIVVTPVIVDISTLGPFKLRVESGTPEMNPMKDTSEWFRNLFLQEMKMMPFFAKAVA